MNYYGQELHTNDAFNGAFKECPHNSKARPRGDRITRVGK